MLNFKVILNEMFSLSTNSFSIMIFPYHLIVCLTREFHIQLRAVKREMGFNFYPPGIRAKFTYYANRSTELT